MKRSKISAGKLIDNDVQLFEFEKRTINFFLDNGQTIILLPASKVKGAKTPDFIMDGCAWEMKCPTKGTRTTLEHAFKAACKQAPNVVFDLRSIRFNEAVKAEKVIVRIFKLSRAAKKLLIITKSNKLRCFDKHQ